MENKDVKSVRKTKKVVILLSAFFLVCAGTLGGLYAYKVANRNADESDKTPKKTTEGSAVLDANGFPEDGSDITETKTADSLDTLRELLAADGKFAINLTKDVKIAESLEVNGTKKLVGNKNIVMELYAQPSQSILDVQAGATLILDGVTLDGNGIANGVKVAKNAGFTGLSGSIIYPAPYGILSAGTMRILDITVANGDDIGVCLEKDSRAYIEGGEIRDCISKGIYIAEGGQADISGDVHVHNSVSCIVNYGTCVMTGGIVSDAYRNLVANYAKLTVDYQGKNKNDRLEWYNSGDMGVRCGGHSKTYINGLYIHDVAKVALRGINHEGMTVENCLLENAGTFGFESANGTQDVSVTNLIVKKSQSSGVRVYGANTINIENLTVTDAGGRGIQNGNSILNIKNAVIENCQKSGVYGGDGSVTNIEDVQITNSQWYGVENYLGTMTARNVKILNPLKSGVFTRKKTVTNLSDITITNSKERGVYNAGGTVTGNKITVESPGTYGVTSSKSGEFKGELTVSNLTVTNVLKNALNVNESIMVVNGVSISKVGGHGIAVYSGGQLTLTGATIKDCDMRGVYVSGKDSKATVANITIQNTGMSGATVAEKATADLTKITMANVGILSGVGTQYSSYHRSGLTASGATMRIKDVTVTNALGSGVYVNGGSLTGAIVKSIYAGENGIYVTSSSTDGIGTLKLEDLEITRPGNRGVYNAGGNVDIKNVQITAPKTYGLTTAKFTGTGAYAGKVTATNLVIDRVEKNHAINCNESVLEVYGGTLSNIAQIGVNVLNGGKVTLEGMGLKDCEQYGIFVTGKDSTAYVKDTQVSQTGWSGVIAGKDGVVNLSNVGVSNAGAKGKSVSYQSGITSSGGTIQASQVSVSDTKAYGIYVNGGNMKGSKVAVTDAGNDGVYVNKSSVYGDAEVIIDGLNATRTADNKTMNRGVNNQRSTVTLENVNIHDLSGGIYSYGGTLNVDGGTVANVTNQGVYLESSKDNGQVVANLSNLQIQNAGNRGIANTGGVLTLEGVTIANPKNYGITTGTVRWTTDGKTTAYTGEVAASNLTVTGVAVNHAINCNASVMTVSGGKISDIKGLGANVVAGGILTLNGVAIEKCKGAVSVTGNSQVMLDESKITETTEQDVSASGAKSSAELKNVEITRTEKNTQGSMTIEEGAAITLKNCSLTGSGSATTQSAIRVNDGNLNIEGGSYRRNVAAANGGVIYVDAKGSVSIKGTAPAENAEAKYVLFQENASVGSTSMNGGVLFVNNGGKVSADYCVFDNNRIEYTGKANTTISTGGVMSISSRTKDNVTITNSKFTGNKAVGGVGRAFGGAISVAGSCALTMSDCQFIDNSVSGGVKGFGGADVRVAGSSMLYVSGNMNMEVFNTTGKYTLQVLGALSEDSNIRLKWDTVNTGTVINFTNMEIMNASKQGVSLDAAHSDYELNYSEANYTAVPVKK